MKQNVEKCCLLADDLSNLFLFFLKWIFHIPTKGVFPLSFCSFAKRFFEFFINFFYKKKFINDIYYENRLNYTPKGIFKQVF